MVGKEGFGRGKRIDGEFRIKGRAYVGKEVRRVIGGVLKNGKRG
jgi:hypothetical protein